MKNKMRDFHDRFFKDHAFRVRMIENNLDKEVCRRCDLEDGDHTYHLSEEEEDFYEKKKKTTAGSISKSRVLTLNH